MSIAATDASFPPIISHMPATSMFRNPAQLRVRIEESDREALLEAAVAEGKPVGRLIGDLVAAFRSSAEPVPSSRVRQSPPVGACREELVASQPTGVTGEFSTPAGLIAGDRLASGQVPA